MYTIPMADQNIPFEKKLKVLTESVGRPNFVLYGWQEEDGTVRISYALHKMSLKAALQSMLHVIKELIDKSMK